MGISLLPSAVLLPLVVPSTGTGTPAPLTTLPSLDGSVGLFGIYYGTQTGCGQSTPLEENAGERSNTPPANPKDGGRQTPAGRPADQGEAGKKENGDPQGPKRDKASKKQSKSASPQATDAVMESLTESDEADQLAIVEELSRM